MREENRMERECRKEMKMKMKDERWKRYRARMQDNKGRRKGKGQMWIENLYRTKMMEMDKREIEAKRNKNGNIAHMYSYMC